VVSKGAARDSFNKYCRDLIMAREIITLACTDCKRRNYTTKKEKRNTPGRIEKKKFCKFDKKHTMHRETK
jgi:large subunit ribosomal protein L33